MREKRGILEFNTILKKSHISGLPACVEWLCLGAILFVAYISFLYCDITDTYDNSILFLKAILSGNLTRFYSYTVENSRMYWAANYDFVIYVVYGIWNIPVLLISRLRGIDYLDWSLGLLWCKTLGIIMTFGTAWLLHKILRLCRVPEKYALLGPFLFLSSICLYLISFVISQVDGFAVFLLTLGFYFYLRGGYARFLICFILTMPTKMFALFLFIPLVLLKEKRIPWILGNIILVFSFSILSKVLFGGDPAYHFALGSQSRDAVLQIMESSTFLGQAYIPFVACYLGLCVFCYLYDGYQKDETKYEIPIWCAAAVWSFFIGFINFNSYWALYLVPFLILAIVNSGRYLKVCCLLELLFSLGYLGVVLSICMPLSDGNLARRLLLPKLFPMVEYELTKYGSLGYLFEVMGGKAYAPFFSTCMGGALLVLLVLTCPFLLKGAKRFEPLERTVLWTRLGCAAGLTAILLYACVKAAPETMYSNFPEEKAPCETNLLPGTCMEQEVVFEKGGELHEMQFYFENPDYIRNNFCSIQFDLVSLKTGETVNSQRIGCSMIKTDERLELKLKGISVEAGDRYLVRMTGIPGILVDRTVGRWIFPYVTEELVDAEHPLYINGMRQDCNLYIRIR